MIKQKIKNPDLKGKEYTDDKFFYGLNNLLNRAIQLKYYKSVKIFNVKRQQINELIDDISSILIYKNIGNKKCTDCKKYYNKCECDYLDNEDFKNLDQIIRKIENLILKYGSKNDITRSIQSLKSQIDIDTDKMLIKFINDSIKRLQNNKLND